MNQNERTACDLNTPAGRARVGPGQKEGRWDKRFERRMRVAVPDNPTAFPLQSPPQTGLAAIKRATISPKAATDVELRRSAFRARTKIGRTSCRERGQISA